MVFFNFGCFLADFFLAGFFLAAIDAQFTTGPRALPGLGPNLEEAVSIRIRRRPLKRIAIPMAETGPRLVGALAEIQQCCAGRPRFANVLIHQKKLAHLLLVESVLRPDAFLLESLRLRH